eukprot:TRINITY_DN65931_c9_g1_i2.p1 TRINITY_DN65931_c9_g1~~TRINITY_DN65931_c9_g1_i2.p1  ORF type:complete len:729 (-),score=425.94 TRINITY_DN65931_c9_g1_i2:1372-3279(-)
MDEDDDEDDEDDEDFGSAMDDLDNDEENAGDDELDDVEGDIDGAMHRRLDQRRDEEDVRRQVAALEQRHARQKRMAEEDGGKVLQHSLMPTVRDSKLWTVGCDPGKEKQAVLTLLNKFVLKRSLPNEKFYIKSAFSTPASSGYVYVEADKEVHVKKAIASVRALKVWRVRLVPIREMVQALTVKTDSEEIKRGQWVRVKRGLYKGDLAQVTKVLDQGMRVTIRMVPRLDMKEARAEGEFNRAIDEMDEDERLRRLAERREQKKRDRASKKRRRADLFRPLPRLFDRHEMRSLGLAVDRREFPGSHVRFDVYGNDRFRRGFLYKDVRVTGLLVDGITPLPEELERFRTRVAQYSDDEEDDEDDEADLMDGQGAGANGDDSNTNNHNNKSSSSSGGTANGSGSLSKTMQAKRRELLASSFTRNDTVKVIKGDLKHLTGKVVSVSGTTITIMPNHEQLNEPLEFPVDELRKFFRVGDHVKILRGQYKDETGLIVKVHVSENEEDGDDMLIVISDISQEEMRVFTQDVIESTEVSTGRDALGDYELYDLVQVNQDAVGVIVKVEIGSFKVLNHSGVIQTVRLQDMGDKKNSRHAQALDASESPIMVDEIVKVNGVHAAADDDDNDDFYREIFLFSSAGD